LCYRAGTYSVASTIPLLLAYHIVSTGYEIAQVNELHINQTCDVTSLYFLASAFALRCGKGLATKPHRGLSIPKKSTLAFNDTELSYCFPKTLDQVSIPEKRPWSRIHGGLSSNATKTAYCSRTRKARSERSCAES
jgi:hypothetical protein